MKCPYLSSTFMRQRKQRQGKIWWCLASNPRTQTTKQINHLPSEAWKPMISAIEKEIICAPKMIENTIIKARPVGTYSEVYIWSEEVVQPGHQKWQWWVRVFGSLDRRDRYHGMNNNPLVWALSWTDHKRHCIHPGILNCRREMQPKTKIIKLSSHNSCQVIIYWFLVSLLCIWRVMAPQRHPYPSLP